MQDSNSIMVIEDDSAVRELIAEVLRDAGHEVVECASAREAFSSLESARPALITLDLAMPAMDGLQFLRHLRMRPDTADLPVIVVTAAPEELRVQIAHVAQATIGKPFHLDDLLAAVEGVLDGVGGRGVASNPSALKH